MMRMTSGLQLVAQSSLTVTMKWDGAKRALTDVGNGVWTWLASDLEEAVGEAARRHTYLSVEKVTGKGLIVSARVCEKLARAVLDGGTAMEYD